MCQTARSQWEAMKIPLWSFPVSYYGHALMFFPCVACLWSLVYFYALGKSTGWCLTAPRGAPFAIRFNHVIAKSSGEANKRFCQGTAVMLNLVGVFSTDPCRPLIWAAAHAVGSGTRCAFFRVALTFDWTRLDVPSRLRRDACAPFVHSFTMFLKDVAPACRCCRNRVEVRALQCCTMCCISLYNCRVSMVI